jgi:hypothetical protein
MTNPTSEPSPVKVHITNAHEIAPRASKTSRQATLGTVVGDATATPVVPGVPGIAFSLVNRSENRGRVTFTFVGAAARNVCYLAVSQGDAQNLTGSIVMDGMVLDYESTDELWLGVPNGQKMSVGITREFVC